MPKGHKPAKSQGYYRSDPASTNQYTPQSSRPNLANISNDQYYPTQQLNMPQQYNHNSSGYTNGMGGPVQLPLTTHHQPQYTQHPLPQQPPLVSIRPSSGAWTPQDDQTLMQARAQGMNWAPIQQAYFPTKTSNACRKRHERLQERRNADDWDGLKLETLAKHYMATRREIWSQLAALTGEKWNVVEQKCMSRGLKNLQTSARSCARRERMLDPNSQSGPQYTGASFDPEDDSGYADELEAEYEADGASDRSSSYQGGGHGYSQSGGSAGSMGLGAMNGPNMGMDMRGLDMRGMDGRWAQHQSRLPSMDMGIDSIINRTHTGPR